MQLPKEFYEALPNRSTSDLADALAKPADYTSEAIRAFEDELRRRGISPASVAAQIEASKAWQEPMDHRAKQPLEWRLRFVFLLLSPFLLLPAVLGYFHYRNRGYKRKASEVVEWTSYGIGSLLLLGVVLNLLQR